MKTEKINIRFGVLAIMILMAALSRLLPHPPNFAPITAMALFGAAYFSNRIIAFLIPLFAMWLSDLILVNIYYADYFKHFTLLYKGFYWVYGSFALISLLGFLFLKKFKLKNLVVVGFASSLLFFLITNYAVWLGSKMYPQTFSGLMSCYAVAIPYFGNTLMGDICYSALLFGSFEYAKRIYPILSPSK